ncbi:MAG: ribonuclease Z [Nanoarchaeota archaeon]
MQMVFLGTSSMVPTKERNVSGIYLEYDGEGILFDCGEGTQRQMNIAGLNRNKIRKILISHWHGDHVSGLIGLLQTMGNGQVSHTVRIWGPKGTSMRMHHLVQSVVHEGKMPIEVEELEPEGVETFFKGKGYSLVCAPLSHTTESLAYALVEHDTRKMSVSKAEKLGVRPGPLLGKLQRGHSVEYKGKTISPDDVSSVSRGKKVCVVYDTEMTPVIVDIAKGADVLVAEATYMERHADKAASHKHMTASQVAQLAGQAGVKRLILTHFSQRYASVSDLEAEAQAVFPESVCAHDLLKVRI